MVNLRGELAAWLGLAWLRGAGLGEGTRYRSRWHTEMHGDPVGGAWKLGLAWLGFIRPRR